MSSLTREEVLQYLEKFAEAAWSSGPDIGKLLAHDAAQRATIEAQAQRIATLEALRVKYGPICLNCGKAEPCMTEAEANQHGGSIPCTFDPAPRELWDRCQQQAQRIRELEEALQEMVDMEASGRCGASEEYILHEWPQRYTAAYMKADEVLRQQKRKP